MLAQCMRGKAGYQEQAFIGRLCNQVYLALQPLRMLGTRLCIGAFTRELPFMQVNLTIPVQVKLLQ